MFLAIDTFTTKYVIWQSLHAPIFNNRLCRAGGTCANFSNLGLVL